MKGGGNTKEIRISIVIKKCFSNPLNGRDARITMNDVYAWTSFATRRFSNAYKS
jgi:hypothetical protein